MTLLRRHTDVMWSVLKGKILLELTNTTISRSKLK